MKKYYWIIFLSVLTSTSARSQNDGYSFINEVITTHERGAIVPLDTIFLREKFINLKVKLNLKHLNEETLKSWWSSNMSRFPPIELFLANFELAHLKSEIQNSKTDENIDFKLVNKFFYSSDINYLKMYPKNKYLSISKPIFNKKKDWCVIVKSQFVPYFNAGGSGEMYVYVRVEGKWILYNVISLWVT